MRKYTFSADNSSGFDDWQTDVNCTIYLTLYAVSMKYIPTVLISVLNLAIAWKLKGIWKRRRQLRNRIGNTQPFNAHSTIPIENATTRLDYSLLIHKLLL